MSSRQSYNRDWWCAACGSDLPDQRMHLTTCSVECLEWLRRDDAKQRRAQRKAQRVVPACSADKERMIHGD